MFKLSICIPTYNREFHLIRTMSMIIEQIRALGEEMNIQLCVSDNGSQDATWNSLIKIKEKNSDITLKLHHFDENQGADINFIQVMGMADGEYSILLGDDDYFINNGLKYVLQIISQYPNVSLFLSSVLLTDKNFTYEEPCCFIRDDIQILSVDFTNMIEARAYFSLCTSVLGLFSFISSVIYKTEAINSEIDRSFIGTCYAFQYYWWHYLLLGKEFMYIKYPYIKATQGTTNDFGLGIKRISLDYNAFILIGEYFFGKSTLKRDFLQPLNRMFPFYNFIAIDERNDFNNVLLPLLKKTDHPYLQYIINNTRLKKKIIYILASFFPSNILRMILKYKNS